MYPTFTKKCISIETNAYLYACNNGTYWLQMYPYYSDFTFKIFNFLVSQLIEDLISKLTL